MLAATDGWWLSPEGAAIHEVERTAVVADVHLGYEWARGSGGDCVPEHSLAEAVERLDRVLGRMEVKRLVVAGDLVEAKHACARTARDVSRLRGWLESRGVELVAVRGNHDPSWVSELATIQVSGWTIGHGDRPFGGKKSRKISGHLHPALRLEGRSFPCFLVGPDRIILPAFTRNAGGVPIQTLAVEPDLRCVACGEGTLYEFGEIRRILGSLG